MAAFDYGNARLRALKSRLLSRGMVESLADAGSLGNMLAALNGTDYRPMVEAALVRAAGLPALADALNRALRHNLGRQPTFYREEPAATYVRWLLRRYDVFNVKNGLRGVSQGVFPDTIQAQMMPVGELSQDELIRLTRAESSVALIGLLATWRSPYAAPLLALQAERPDADLFRRELALDRWWSRGAWPAGRSPIWRDYVIHHVDSANIMVALRMVGVVVEPARLLSLFIDVPQAEKRLLPAERLATVANAPDVDSAVARLAATAYGDVLRNAWDRPDARRRLSDLEQALDRRWLRTAQSLFHRDPLGVGVPLGYLALKINEIRNLRLIGHALFLEEPPDQIARRLVFP